MKTDVDKLNRLTLAGRKKISEATKRTYTEGRLHRHTSDTLKKMWQKSNEITRGKHGFGRQAKGRPDHSRALIWVIQSPDGNDYIITNLVEWCRQNEYLFPEMPNAKMPTWKRAADGLYTAYKRGYSWHKWHVILCSEQA
jgi:hypothetical protein